MTFALSQRSLDKLKNVHPDLVRVVKRAIEITEVDFGVLQGARTKEEQAKLYAQGRTVPGYIVTWTLDSRHIGGFAVDLGAFVDGVYVPGDTPEELELYDKIADAVTGAALDLKIAVKWGVVKKDGQRTDKGHFELHKAEYPS